MAKYDIKPEPDIDAVAPELKFDDAIRILQVHERARQGHHRVHLQREIRCVGCLLSLFF